MHEEIKELRKLEAQMKEIAEHITEDRTMIENMAYEVSENCKSAFFNGNCKSSRSKCKFKWNYLATQIK